MKKEYLKNIKDKKILISFYPENANECVNWYDKCYMESLNQYKLIFLKLQTFLVNYKSRLISDYNSFEKLNLIQKKKGIQFIYSKFGKLYTSIFEKIVILDGTEHIFAICDSNENLFETRIPSVLCFMNNDFSDEDLFNKFCDYGLKKIEEDILNGTNVIVKFNDIGCDGNSITIYCKNLADELFNSIKL